ncbi:hypothetical protein CAEBREN_30632 [Caenorhabditis brenneri]|uniref:TIL domain-containing protein n=1 Tax=Caenorhabditis brenneri TaxID=135651 RepID=G0MRS7_CAEBE|nr:hypothetical protein CAEBREN_30632 [Caenorhabditis brenneri]
MKLLISLLVALTVFGFASSAGQRCGENEIFNECGSPCDRTCAEPTPTCIEMCKARCECKQGFVIHPTTKKCVNIKNCPK